MSFVFFLMIRRPPRSTLDRSSAASDVYKRQDDVLLDDRAGIEFGGHVVARRADQLDPAGEGLVLSLIHISEPTRPY